MPPPELRDAPPDTPSVTDYDRAHLVTYLRLLDAADEGADWREVVRVVFAMDPDREPERARAMHAAHLARARWMTEIGWAELIERRGPATRSP